MTTSLPLFIRIALICCLSIFIPFSTNAQLNGSYTIGGISPNYATVSAAVSDLIANGVGGPVIFDIRNGTYNVQVSIDAIAGVSAVNNVIFQSQNGDSTLVNLTFFPDSTNNYVLRLNGANYVTFKKITFKAMGSFYSTAISIKNSSSFCAIESCVVEGSLAFSTLTALAVIYEDAGTNTNNKFRNNLIDNGSYGIYYNGSFPGITIEDNIIRNQYHRGIEFFSLQQPQVKGNIITTNVGLPSYRAIYLQSCSQPVIVKNQISFTSGQYGIYLTSCTGTSGVRGLIANNFVLIGGTSGAAHGIYHSYSNYQNYYYNSVNITRPSTTTSAFYQAGTTANTNIRLQNNIFANPGGGYAIFINHAPSIDFSNYNNLYTGGSDLGYWPSTFHANLALWQTGSGMDANSVSINPEFVSSTDLHVQAYLLDDMGFPVSEVLDDIDGQARDLATPDIGADEWTTPVNDAGIVSIDKNLTYCITNNNVYVNLKNFGTDALIGVTINWEVNGVTQAPFAWTGSLGQGATEGPVNIGPYAFNLGTPYTIKTWTTNPNGTSEGFNHNDTCQLTNVYQALFGIYTIGGTAPDYATINAAVSDLVNGGVCGPVVFNIRDGIYNEQVSIDSISGVSTVNTITFQSELGDSSQVLITNVGTGGSNYTVRLNGADHITLSKLTILATDPIYASVLFLEGGSSYNKVENCVLESAITPSQSTNASIIFEGFGTNTHNEFRNNLFDKGGQGIYYVGMFQGIVIENNIFRNQYLRGITVYYLQQVQINGNLITSNSTSTSFTAISLIQCPEVTVVKNKINTTQMGSGIFISSCVGSPNAPGLIANNFISMSGGMYGIFQTSGSMYQYYYHNSVHLSSPYPGAASFHCVGNGSGYNRFQNNILSNTGGGYAINVEWISTFSISDYNNLHATGPTLGFYLNASCANLASWQLATGMDSNSLSVNPNFVSASDLHICNAILDSGGFPVSQVTDDIDGQTRSLLTPAIGADEFGQANVNLGISQSFCDTTILNAGNNGSTFFWSTGATTQTITVSASGSYWVQITNSCGTASDTIIINILGSPPIPVVTPSGNILSSNYSTGNQWNFNGTPMLGDTSQLLTMTSSGLYSVTVTDQNGCYSTSALYNHIITNFGIGETKQLFTLFPNPSTDKVTITLIKNINIEAAFIKNLLGETIMVVPVQNLKGTSYSFDAKVLGAGVYFFTLQLEGQIVTKKLVIE